MDPTNGKRSDSVTAGIARIPPASVGTDVLARLRSGVVAGLSLVLPASALVEE